MLLWHGSVQVTSFLSATKAMDGLDGLVLVVDISYTGFLVF